MCSGEVTTRQQVPSARMRNQNWYTTSSASLWHRKHYRTETSTRCSNHWLCDYIASDLESRNEYDTVYRRSLRYRVPKLSTGSLSDLWLLFRRTYWTIWCRRKKHTSSPVIAGASSSTILSSPIASWSRESSLPSSSWTMLKSFAGSYEELQAYLSEIVRARGGGDRLHGVPSRPSLPDAQVGTTPTKAGEKLVLQEIGRAGPSVTPGEACTPEDKPTAKDKVRWNIPFKPCWCWHGVWLDKG